MLARLLHRHKKAELAQLIQRVDSISCKKSSSKSEMIDSLVGIDIEDFTTVLAPLEINSYLALLKLKPKCKSEENLAELNQVLKEGETLDGKEVIFFDRVRLKNDVKSMKALFRSKDISLIKQALEILDSLTPSYAYFYTYLEAFGYPIEKHSIFDRKVLTEILFGKSIVRHYNQYSNVQYVGWWCLGKLASFPEFKAQQKNIRQLEARGIHWEEFPETITNFSEITEVICFGGTYSEFPEELFAFEKLQVLYLRSNSLRKLPKRIKSFKKLKQICLEYNQVQSLPDEIGELSVLSEFVCRSTHLTSLPETISRLSCLEKMDISSNQIKKLPSNIIELRSLKSLNISGNPIRELPEGLSRLGIKNLIFDKEIIEFLPDDFTLNDLHLKFNLSEFRSLQKLPAGLINIRVNISSWKKHQERICDLSKLRSLHIEDSTFYQAFTRYGSIQNMNYFGFHTNGSRLAVLTESIGKLNTLRELDISHNQFKFLPENIGKLEFLQFLRVKNCSLVALPRSVNKLQLLEVLDVSNNRLREVCEEIGSMKSLIKLYLNGNALLDIPETIQGLERLKTLHLEDNALQKLPDSIGQLSRLRRLYLKDNPLSNREKERIRALLPNTTIEF